MDLYFLRQNCLLFQTFQWVSNDHLPPPVELGGNESYSAFVGFKILRDFPHFLYHSSTRLPTPLHPRQKALLSRRGKSPHFYFSHLCGRQPPILFPPLAQKFRPSLSTSGQRSSLHREIALAENASTSLGAITPSFSYAFVS